jgi:hypothetical protein
MPSPSPSPADSLLSRTVEHTAHVWPLVVVPLVATLLEVGRLRALLRTADPAPAPANGDTTRVVISEPDRLFSVTFGVPRPVSTLWSFVNAQPEGVSTGAVGFDSVAVFVVALLVASVVSGLLAAGYLGSIDAALDGRFDFLAAVRSYGRPLVGFSLLEAGVSLLLVAVGLVALPLVVVVGTALFVLAYLFFTTPYLVVVDDLGLAPALRRAFELATSEGRVLGFFVGYVVVSALLSVPISALAFAAPPVGVALAVLVSAPVALLLNVATLLFVRDLVRAQSSSNIPVDM